MSKKSFKRRMRPRIAPTKPLPKPLPSKTLQRSLPYIPPTDDQLVRFIIVITFGPGQATPFNTMLVKSTIEHNSNLKHLWLERHREIQELANRLDHE